MGFQRLFGGLLVVIVIVSAIIMIQNTRVITQQRLLSQLSGLDRSGPLVANHFVDVTSKRENPGDTKRAVPEWQHQCRPQHDTTSTDSLPIELIVSDKNRIVHVLTPSLSEPVGFQFGLITRVPEYGKGMYLHFDALSGKPKVKCEFDGVSAEAVKLSHTIVYACTLPGDITSALDTGRVFVDVYWAGTAIVKQRQLCAESPGDREGDIEPVTLAMCTQVHNQASHLPEWLEYHRMIGVDHVVLYLHQNSDDTKKILKPWLKDGFVTLYDWNYPVARGKKSLPWLEGHLSVQYFSMNDCIYRHRRAAKWMMMIDVDEFLISTNYNTNYVPVSDTLEAMAERRMNERNLPPDSVRAFALRQIRFNRYAYCDCVRGHMPFTLANYRVTIGEDLDLINRSSGKSIARTTLTTRQCNHFVCGGVKRTSTINVNGHQLFLAHFTGRKFECELRPELASTSVLAEEVGKARHLLYPLLVNSELSDRFRKWRSDRQACEGS